MSGNSSNSFLPRLRSVFYARFHESRGPEIAYQVPEGLIASSTGGFISSTGTSPTPSGSSRASSIIIVPPDRSSESRVKASSHHRSSFSSNRTLLNFDDISKYIIAQSPLCGRLVTCTAGIYKVLGFPVELLGNYKRYFFRFNICFVFDASADLSCYEPIVRKVNRVLTACEVSLHLSPYLACGINSEIRSKSRRFCRRQKHPLKYMLYWSNSTKI
jgi:hypothetical protein